jgi:hypothetical protein
VWHPLDLAPPDRAAFSGAALDVPAGRRVRLCARGCRVVALREVEGMLHLPAHPATAALLVAIPETCPPGEGMSLRLWMDCADRVLWGVLL